MRRRARWQVVALCTAEVVRTEVRHGDRMVAAAEGPWLDEAALATQWQALAEEARLPPSGRRLAVVVQRPAAQVRRLTQLPPVSARHLGALVAAQTARTFRRNGVPLVTAARWVPHSTPRAAELAAIPAPLLDQLAAAAAAAGLELTSVTAADAPALPVEPPLLTRHRVRTLRQRTARWARLALTLWIIAGAVAGARFTQERMRVRAALASRAEPAAALARLRAEWVGAQTSLAAVATADREGAAFLQQLTSVLTALPDSAFLAALTLDAGGTGSFSGYARRATDVAAALAHRPHLPLPLPRLDASLGREALGGREWDRFRVTLGDTTATAGAGAAHAR